MLMARDLLRVLDPAAIADDVGMTLDDWQRDLMRSIGHGAAVADDHDELSIRTLT